MKEKTLGLSQMGQEQQTNPDQMGQRRVLDLDWTESEWFKVWLQLARDRDEGAQN